MSNDLKPVPASPHLLRFALGLIYFHFGFLKFFPDLSPAEMIASQTIMRLSAGNLDERTILWWLAVVETAIGVGFLMNAGLRIVSVLFLLHMLGTFMPLFVFPELTFKIEPFAPTLEGQYILKNIVFFAAGWTVLLPDCFPRLSGWVLSTPQLRTGPDRAVSNSKLRSELGMTATSNDLATTKA